MWTDQLQRNPINYLLGSDNQVLIYWVERDILEFNQSPAESLWTLPEVEKMISKQLEEGCWRYKGNRPGDELGENYELLQTWKNLRILVEKYGMNRNHLCIQRAAEFVLSCQTEEGDIRGILSNQYMPYYMGALMELLIKAGYQNDYRVMKGFDWLLEMRQEDGGWIIPLMMFKQKEYYRLCQKMPIPPDKEKPFSHMATGMVIRAFAAHPGFRTSSAAITAGNLLKTRFFKKDVYSSRSAVSYWFKFQFPFWWTDLLTVMDSLMRMDFSAKDLDIQNVLDWLIDNQSGWGGWSSRYGKSKDEDADRWVSFAICRVLKYFLTNLEYG